MRHSTVLFALLLVHLGAANDVPTVASLDLTVTSITCSNINISWTPVEQETLVNASAHYSSSIHSGVMTTEQVDEQVDEPAHTLSLSNLVADTMYTITVTVKYNDSTTASGNITANTMPGTPFEKGISITFNGSTTLSFNVKDPGPDAKHDCWINSTNAILYRLDRNHTTMVTGLCPGTYYNITCQKRLSKPNKGCPLTHTVVTTKPSPPDKVSILETTCNSVVVNWAPPADNGNVELTQYRVLVYKDSTQVIINTTITTMELSHRVSSLEPDTVYTVEVKAGNVGGFGNGTNTIFTTKQIGTIPITSSLVQSTKANFTINGTEGVMYTCNVNNQIVTIKAGQPVPQTGLHPNTSYTINCQANGCLVANTTFITALAPGVVTSLTRGSVSVSEDGSIQQNITWNAPTSPAADMEYLIKYGLNASSPDEASFKKTTTSTMLTLALSVPEESQDELVYIIWVAVVTASQEQGNFEMLTIQYNTPGTPTDISVQVMSCHTLNVIWSPPAETGGLPITGYNISYSATTNTLMRHVCSSDATVSLQQLNPGTEYTVRVKAINAIGAGEFTDGNSGNITESRCKGYVSATANSAHSILLSHNLTESGVYYLCNVAEVEGGEMEAAAVDKSVTTQVTNVTGLLSDTTYRVYCVAYNSTGVEVCLEANTTVTTLPDKVQNIMIKGEGIVMNVNGMVANINQRITWDAPSNHHNIRYYLIKYGKADEVNSSSDDKIMSAMTQTNITEITLTPEVPKEQTTYSVWVAAMSDAGQGEFSDRTQWNYSRPGVPRSPQVNSTQSCHTLKVTWQPPNHNGGLAISGYNISYTDTTTSAVMYSYSETEVVSIQLLNPGTTYSVQVKTINVIGEGNGTENITETTVNRDVGYVSVRANSAHSILLSHNLTESGVYYLCNVTEVEGEEMKEVDKNVTTQVTNVTGLNADTTYRVDCVAYNSTGVEVCLESNTTVTTLPGKVPTVMIKDKGMTSNGIATNARQMISWDAPSNHPNIRHYLIKYGKADEVNSSSDANIMSAITQTNVTTITLMLKVPKEQTTYSVWVAAVSDAGQGEFSDRKQWSYSRPGVPKSPQVSPTQSCHILKVTWQPPNHNGGLTISGYNISYTDTTTSAVKYSHSESGMVSIQLLNPGTNYSVQVKTINVIGEGNGTGRISATTKSRGKGYVNVRANSAHSILLSHNLTESGVYYLCSVTEVKGGEIKEVDRNVTTQVTNVTGLLPDTTYRVDCVAYNSTGVEVCLEANTTMTTRPDKVQNVTIRGSAVRSVNGTMITINQNITWDAPPNHSNIQHYVVKYMLADKSSCNVTRTINNITLVSLELLAHRSEAPINYSVQVAAVSSAGQGEFSERIPFSYSSPGKPTNVNVQAISCDKLMVTWGTPNQTGGLPIVGYSVTTGSTVTSFSTKQTALIIDHQPGTEYTITVQARNVIGQGLPVEKTGSPQARGKGYVSVRANSDQSILLSHNLTESGVYYLCSVTEVEGGVTKAVNKNVTTQVTNVTGLLPDTTYRVYCVAYNSTGVEICLEANTTVTTRPDKVENVTIRGSMAQTNSEERITINQNVTWDEPTNHSNIQHYVVSYQKQGQSNSNVTRTTASATWVTLELLVHQGEAPINYSVQVAAVSSAGQGEFSERIQFNYSTPGTPTGVSVQALSCHSLNVTWSPPEETGGLPVTGYNISYTDTANNVSHGFSKSAAVSLQQLSPGTKYVVRVKAINAVAVGEFTDDHDNSGNNTESRREGYVNATANSAHSILLSHNLTESGVYYLCNVTEVEGGKMKAVDKNVTTQVTNVTGLLPDTTYGVDCVAYNSDGTEHCLEANTTVTTRPGRVHNVTIQDSTTQSAGISDMVTITQNITWNAPPNHHNIQHYVVTYEMEGQYTSNVTNNNATQATLVLLVLKEQTSTFTVWVAAVSEAGRGEYSDRVEFNYSRPDPPTGLMAVKMACNSINISWSAPSYTGGVPLERYTVRWNGSGSSLMSSGTDMTAGTVEPLIPNTSYTINVTAVNAIGEGEESEELAVITTSQDKPLLVSLETISSTSLHISTQPPELAHATVNCTLTAKEDTSYIYTVQNLNQTHGQLVTNLSPYTTYTATCLVFKDGVDQCYIGNDTTQTYTDIPSASPQGVAIHSTSSQSFIMRWDPPPKRLQNGKIMSYEVHYREEGSNSTVVNDTTEGMMYTAEDLTTDRVYQFRVAATTVNGTGPDSEWIHVATIPTVTNLIAVNTTTNSIIITWDEPDEKYNVWLYGEATDNIPQNRSIDLIDVTGQTTLSIRGLNSFRNYSISVYLETEMGNGSDTTVTVQTLGRAPDRSPTNLTANSTSRSVTLEWSPPPVLSRNGILTHYVVTLANETTMWNITQSHKVAVDLRRRREAVSEGVGEETQSLRVRHLKPFTNYTWEVEAVSDFGSSPPSERRRFETDQDVPTHVNNISVNPDQKTITWTAPAETNGIIVRYTVQYWELGRNNTAEESNTTAEERMFPYSNLTEGVPYKVQVQAATVAGLGESRVVEEVLFSEEQAPAVSVSNITVTRVNDTAVMITWRALTLNEARGFPSYVVNVTTDNKKVAHHSTNSTSVMISGLMPHTEYNITVQALTAGGTKEGPQSEPVTIEAIPVPTVATVTLSTWMLAVIAVVVVLVAAIIFVVVIAVICRRCRHKDKDRANIPDLWENIPMKEMGVPLGEGLPPPLDLPSPVMAPEDSIQRKEPVLRRNFCEHVQKMHQDKDALFLAEYQSITNSPDGVNSTVCLSNMIKNRYINVFPYDHSRVVLYERDENGSDYINAAYIDAYNRTNGYIATQGPTPETVADFWQMVWENHAPVIVMLTKLVETRTKCEQYWSAELNAPFLPGRDLSVTTVRFDTHPEFELRTFKVEKTTSKQEPLVVKHFLYTAWPDHGVPQYSSSIHRFISERVRPVYKDSPAPLIVHCSAGAGRTGTYMAIDTMMYQLEEREDINIFEYVEKMRTRRTQMVQNASQYIYIHDAVNDYINCKTTTIVAHELRPRIEELRQIDPATKSNGFVPQFLLLEEVSTKMCDADYAFAEEGSVKKRNRYKDLCTYSDKYVTKEDDRYVNASEISGYCRQRNFIAAQAPMGTTEEDVWEMICEETCSTVVVLCNFIEDNEEMCSMFWPLKTSEPKEFDYIKICLEEKEEQDYYNKYQMTVSCTDNPKPLKVVVFHYLQWPHHSRPTIPTFLQLMGEVERSQHKAKGPTLVMCNDGMSRTGVFITAMAEVERVKVQGEVDIFQTVKAARSERPHMVSTPVDYEVCHDILVSYLESFDTYANFK